MLWSLTVVYTNSVSYCVLRSCDLVHVQFLDLWVLERDMAPLIMNDKILHITCGSTLTTLVRGLLRWKVLARGISFTWNFGPKALNPEKQSAGSCVGEDCQSIV